MNLEILLPSPTQTAKSLVALAGTALFWKSLGLSMLRVLIGILCSVIIGTLLAVLTSASGFARALLSPLMGAVKSVPVACFIVLVFLWMNTATIPIFITALIVWSNVSQGIASTDKNLREVAQIFGFSRAKRLRVLYVPSVFPYFMAACRSALGMAWKAGIAAEVLAPPLFGIGKGIYLAKTDFDSAALFAWTFVIVIVSYVVERLFVLLLDRTAHTLRLHMGGDTDAEA